jgi:hypothetical protein
MNKNVRNLALGALGIMLLVGVMAMWSDTLRANVTVETGTVDIGFVPGSLIYLDACGLSPGYGQYGGYDWNASNYPNLGAYQLDDGKDVGCTDVTMNDTDGDGDLDTMTVNLNNVYPWYYTHIAFKIENTGTIPVKIWRIVIISPDGNRTYYEINAEGVENGVLLDLDNDGNADVRMWWGDNFGVQLHPGNSSGDISFDITVLQEAPQGANLSFSIMLQAIQWNEYDSALPTTTSPQ